MSVLRFSAIVIAGLLHAACASSPAVPTAEAAMAGGMGTAIVDVTVINPGRQTVEPHMTVLVQGQRIVSVQPASAPVGRDYRRIDASGRFLIPGLWDGHTHVSKSGRNSLALFLANGVTGVRDMGSNLDEARTWRAAVAEGRMDGPRLLIAGPMLESRRNYDRLVGEGGVENVVRQRAPVGNPDEARATVASLAEAGVDHIKMRSTPDFDTLRAVGDAAQEHGLPFAAHPLGSAQNLADAGLDSIEHLLDVPVSTRTPAEQTALFEDLARRRVSVTTSAVTMEKLGLAAGADAAGLADAAARIDPHRQYVCGYLLRDWQEQLDGVAEQYAQNRTFFDPFNRQVREMAARGVNIIPGSDAAVLLVHPGFSLHDELRLMVDEMGLAPMQVLAMAATGVPRYFGREGSQGSLEAGHVADMVLLDANPLDDIRNTTRIAGVMANGRWYDRAALDELLAGVARDVETDCAGGSHAGDRP